MDQDENRYVKQEVRTIAGVITILFAILVTLFAVESRTALLTNLLGRFIP